MKALSPQTSISYDARGKLTRGQPSLGAEPLLLPKPHSDQRRGHSCSQQDPAFRLAWRKRILDHDGDGVKPGGIEVAAAGRSHRSSRPDASMRRNSSWHALAVRLTSTLFPRARISKPSPLPHGAFSSSSRCAWIACASYPWLSSGLDYSTGRLTQAPGRRFRAPGSQTRTLTEDQNKAHAALRAKCGILWAQLDALYFAYVQPGWPPPSAFRPAAEAVPDEY